MLIGGWIPGCRGNDELGVDRSTAWAQDIPARTTLAVRYTRYVYPQTLGRGVSTG